MGRKEGSDNFVDTKKTNHDSKQNEKQIPQDRPESGRQKNFQLGKNKCKEKLTGFFSSGGEKRIDATGFRGKESITKKKNAPGIEGRARNGFHPRISEHF